MPNTDYYFDVLKHAEAIKKSITDKSKDIPNEADSTYALAFAMLIRNGIPCGINYHKDDTFKRKEKKATDMFFEEVVDEDPMANAMVELTDDIGIVHEIKPELLKKIMGNDYSDYIITETDSKTDNNEESKSDILKQAPVADISTDEDDDEEAFDSFFNEPDNDEEQSNSESSQSREASSQMMQEDIVEEIDRENIDSRIPELPEDLRYKPDQQGVKETSTFLCDIHHTRFTVKGKETRIDLFVYPLSVKDNARSEDIFVAAHKGDSVRAAVSKGRNSSLRLDIDTTSFLCRGRWENGEFISQVTAVNGVDKDSQADTIKKVRRTKNTSSVYVRLATDDKDTVLAIFPASEEDGNDQNLGTAPSALLVRTPSEAKVLTPTSDGTFKIGKLTLVPYWLPGAFHVDTEEE